MIAKDKFVYEIFDNCALELRIMRTLMLNKFSFRLIFTIIAH